MDRTVGLLTETDPICDDWIRFANELGERTQNWADGRMSIPAAKWTAEERDVFEDAGRAMSSAADLFESLLTEAKHIVVQELVAQTVVYFRTYAQRVPNYVESDRLISGAAFNFMNAVTHMCSTSMRATEFSQDSISSSSTTENPSALHMVVKDSDPVCAEFARLNEQEDLFLSGWMATADATVPAVQWNSEDKALFKSVESVLKDSLPQYQRVAEAAKGRVLGDFLFTIAAYRKAFIGRIPSYEPADADLWTVITSIGGGVSAACGDRS
ncbi:hypothetical protein [Mycolicibacterium vaccae]|uniref:hypothetical protein n=1 Tax=Mycolicibacterium vaccae TaxID=1810 RepID=UPI003CFCB058